MNIHSSTPRSNSTEQILDDSPAVTPTSNRFLGWAQSKLSLLTDGLDRIRNQHIWDFAISPKQNFEWLLSSLTTVLLQKRYQLKMCIAILPPGYSRNGPRILAVESARSPKVLRLDSYMGVRREDWHKRLGFPLERLTPSSTLSSKLSQLLIAGSNILVNPGYALEGFRRSQDVQGHLRTSLFGKVNRLRGGRPLIPPSKVLLLISCSSSSDPSVKDWLVADSVHGRYSLYTTPR